MPSFSHLRRQALVMLVTLGLLGWAPLAAAHAILVASEPAVNGTVAAGHVAMSLRYNSRIDPRRSRLSLITDDQKTSVLAIADGSTEDVLKTEADLTPGHYTLRWQVLAIDGHITRGDVPFTVTER